MKKLSLILLIIIIAVSSCTENRDILGPYVNDDFKERFKDGLPPTLDSIFTKTDITNEEKAALSFLYAYMPLSDVLNYDANFHLENVRGALKAIDEMPWGNTIPDRIFRYFVLPARVFNEDLDLSRSIFYDELKDRVKGLTIEEAILETNHWCHEKATYQETDSRTNSPLATIRAGVGRCGEESALLVAALRSIGIPARQVSVPRWAHCDDNHAWVEAWANGRWHFLGACEPEPALDLGWFNQAASRAMLITTRVFGYYNGVEEALEATPMFTTINVTANYAATSTKRVMVKDENGNPVPDAEVSFCIYNNAEFHPVITLKTNEKGMASIQAGIGDMMAWVKKGDRFAVEIIKPEKDCDVTLNMSNSSNVTRKFDIVPPISYLQRTNVPQDKIDKNEARKAYEDSLRNAYEETFYNPRQSTALALKIEAHPSRVQKIMTDSKGNWPTIEAFLLSHRDNTEKALSLLESISEKDLNDITAETLEDHIATPDVDSDLYKEYILSPRISNERTSPYKHLLRNALQDKCPTPEALVNWVMDSIDAESTFNIQRLPIIPSGILKARKCGWHSRDIFFVAAARSLGFPARIDPVTGYVQYHDSEKWVNVKFSKNLRRHRPNGNIQFTFEDRKSIDDLHYYSSFTLSKIDDGTPHLLEYPDSFTPDSFLTPRELEAGQYMLITGERLPKGGVKAYMTIFQVEADKTTQVPFVMRHDPITLNTFGTFDSNSSFIPLGLDKSASIVSLVGSGCYIVGFIDPRHEPSVHLLNELSSLSKSIDKLDYKIILLMPEEAAKTFDATAYPSLPKSVIFGIDTEDSIFNLVGEYNVDSGLSRPVLLLADTFNRALWVSQGYNAGLGQQTLYILGTLNK